MAKGARVGFLRWDLIANTEGLVGGLRKAEKEVDRFQRRTGAGGAGMGGRIDQLRRGPMSMQRFAAVSAGVAAGFSLLAVALDKLTNSIEALNKINTDRVRQLQASTRRVQGRTFGQAQAIERAAADPFARGAAFHGARPGIMGQQQLEAFVRVSEAQRDLAEQTDRLNNAMQWYTSISEANKTWYKARWTQMKAASAEWVQSFWTSAQENYGTAKEQQKRQKLIERLSARTAQSFAGTVGAAPTARAGTAEEYQFFVRRQARQRNETMELAREQNVLLREISEKIGRNNRDPITGEDRTTARGI